MGRWKARTRVLGRPEKRDARKDGRTSGRPSAAVPMVVGLTTVVGLSTLGPTRMGSKTEVGPIGAQVRTPLILVNQFLRIGLCADSMPDEDRGRRMIEQRMSIENLPVTYHPHI